MPPSARVGVAVASLLAVAVQPAQPSSLREAVPPLAAWSVGPSGGVEEAALAEETRAYNGTRAA